MNLYSFVRNGPLGRIDKLGTVPVTFEHPDDPRKVPVINSREIHPRRWQGSTSLPRFLRCNCDEKCRVSCDVWVFPVIVIYLRHVENYQGMLSHEQRHIMSRIAQIHREVVVPLRAAQPSEFDDPQKCEKARADYEREYSEKLWQIDSGRNRGDHKHVFGDHDKASTKWSPYDAKDHPPIIDLEVRTWMWEITYPGSDLGSITGAPPSKWDEKREEAHQH